MRLAKPNGALSKVSKVQVKRFFNIRAWTAALLLARLTAVLIVLTVAALAVHFTAEKQTPKTITYKEYFSNLRKANDCHKGLNAISNLQPDPKDPDYTIELLKYKTECQQKLELNTAAVQDLQKLEKTQAEQKKYKDAYETQLQLKEAQDNANQELFNR